MSERYKNLYRLSPNLYTSGSPVVIAAGALLQDTKTGKLLAQLKIKNIQDIPVKMVTAEIIPLDPVGRPLGGPVVHKYMDLHISRGSYFGTQEPIPISEADARSIEVRITEVCFADNTVWSSNGAWTALPDLRPIETLITDSELVKQYQLTYGANAKYRASAMSDLWYCTCGEINRESEAYCHHCRNAFATVSQPNLAELEKAKETRRAEEARQHELAEEKRKAEAEKARIEAAKRKKRLGIFLASVTMIAVAIYIITQVIVPNIRYKNALEMMEAGSYIEALVAFEALDGYKDSAQQITRCETAILDNCYADAVALMEAGSYIEAIAAFEALDDYKDSSQQITECQTAIAYGEAISMMKAGSYNEAIIAFEALDGYKDSNTMIFECHYNQAVALLESGNYTEAIAAFETLCDYRDSGEKAKLSYEKYKTQVLGKARVGDYVYFGAYKQNSGTTNASEYIKWQVLKKDGNRILVISEHSLEGSPYHTEDISVTWATCSLRKWLNDEFFNAAFSSQEQNSILTTTVEAHKNPDQRWNDAYPGQNTQDKVFLLSIQEAEQYFRSDEARKCAPTAYASAHGARSRWGDYVTESGKFTCTWWLRSPGFDQSSAAVVNESGALNTFGYSVNGLVSILGVRPAMWIDLDA